MAEFRLEIRIGFYSSGPTDFYAQAPVSADGSFSIQLPGEADVAPYLFDATPYFFGPGPEEYDLSISPAAYRTLGTPDFALYSDGQLVDKVLHTRQRRYRRRLGAGLANGSQLHHQLLREDRGSFPGRRSRVGESARAHQSLGFS